jgi:hypothetical protein
MAIRRDRREAGDERMEHEIFISHSSKDAAIAKENVPFLRPLALFSKPQQATVIPSRYEYSRPPAVIM